MCSPPGGSPEKQSDHQLGISPLTVILLLAILILLGGIMGLSYFGASISITVCNLGCPAIPLGEEMPEALRRELSDYGVAVPDWVETDDEKKISVPSVPVPMIADVVEGNQLRIRFMDRPFLIPLPSTVDSVKFDDQEVLSGSVTRQLAENPSHEIVIQCRP